MSLTDEIRDDMAGIAIITDWIGAGGVPASPELASRRASICVSCPHNVAGEGAFGFIKMSAANNILKALELKNRIKLHTEFDDKLMVCTACHCSNRLKVHAPYEHIRAHMTDATINKTPEFCWLRSEGKL